jgi:peptidoglycan/xylan/chitin deacetylase (PgdA/CDA1 family)
MIADFQLLLLVLIFLVQSNWILHSCDAVADVYYSIEQKSDAKNVALTFDDGPHGILTPKLLDILKEQGAKATFFVMGVKAIIHPEIILRAHNEGHEIANHVWDHPVLTKITYEKLHHQLSITNDAIYKALNVTPAVMRPPYGNTNRKLNSHIAKHENLTVIMWSHDTNDWRRPPYKNIFKSALEVMKPGTVLLCHDIHPGTIKAMPAFIEQAKKNGYNFLTVSKMIENAK